MGMSTVERVGLTGEKAWQCTLNCHTYYVGLLFAFLLCLVCADATAEEREAKEDSPLHFLSTQFAPLHESDIMRHEILKDYPGKVDFQPYDERAVFMQLALGGGTGEHFAPELLGGLHGDLLSLYHEGGLAPLDIEALQLQQPVIPEFMGLGKFAQDGQYYLPWMQATYIMAANRKALRYLPKGARLESLSYSQLLAWAKNMQMASGSPRLGFPAGRRGLMHRFFQGYLYPSYTGSTLTRFASAEAIEMWTEFSSLWQYVHPNSLTYDRMDEALLSGEVWVAWDHTARLLSAFERRADDFVAFPAPIGPHGRGYMLVLAGLALPKATSGSSQAKALVEYLLRPEIQLATLQKLGFFPVVETGNGGLSPGIASLADAVRTQATSAQSLATLLPSGLGEQGRRFSLAYLRAFSQIVLRGREPDKVLERQARTLREIMAANKAPCWAPDAVTEGPCEVE